MKRSLTAGVIVGFLLFLTSCTTEGLPQSNLRAEQSGLRTQESDLQGHRPDMPTAVTNDHLLTVVGNAAMVANPEHKFIMGGSELWPVLGGYEFRFTGIAARPYAGPSISFESPYWVKMSPSGEVRDVSKLPPTGLTAAVDEFGSGARGISGVESLSELKPGVMTTTVIEFKKPVTEKSLGLENGPARDVFLSRGRVGGEAMYWPAHEGCSDKGLPEPCVDYSSVSQFRSWVSTLTAEDEPILARFGLNLADLRSAAHDGLIYGIIANFAPYAIRKHAKGKNVQAVWITEIRSCPAKKDCP
ncbi:hypothetical protein [Streptosporangium sp. NPDC002524]|uniref:hypothetical protein n=1 Tax=Streptosporangium sp. NPDC002524 TaxID=3154537 RepID=UPI003316DB9D